MARTRNQEHNQITIEAIKTTARRLMGEGGTAGISLRAIAKAMKMTPPAIYHYFASLDDLITALIADNFNALADALETARDQDYPKELVLNRLIGVLLAYRRWAVENPVDFQLIYGNPIPGYVAPREVTVPAVIRGFAVIVGLIEALLRSGEVVVPPPYDVIPREREAHFKTLIARDGYAISTLAFYLGILGWERLHGMIVLEVFHHTQAVVGDSEAHYREEMLNMLRTFGARID